MVYFGKIISVLIVFIVAFSGCGAIAGPMEESAILQESSVPTSDPTPEVPVESAAEEVPQKESSGYSKLDEERVYSIEDFLDLEVGRTTVLDLIDMTLGKPSYTTNLSGDAYVTEDPDIVIYMNLNSDYPIVDFFAIRSLSGVLHDENTIPENNLDLESVGASKIEGSPEEWTWEVRYTFQDFRWIQIGKTTLEELCQHTAETDYFEDDENRKQFWYPTENPATWICVEVNEQNLVHALTVSWDPQKEPYRNEIAYTLKPEYREKMIEAVFEYVDYYGKQEE